MWKRLLAVLMIVLLGDAIFLIVVADWLSWPVTVLLVVLTALLGTLFVHAEGRHTVRRFQRALTDGRPPTNELLDGAFLIAAGVLLLAPGLVTDAIGFVFILPPTRYALRGLLKKFVIRPYVEKKTGGFVSGDVYTYGFPDEGENETVDIGSESYDVGESERS